MAKSKTRQVRLPTGMIDDILKLKNRMEKESVERYGKKKPCTFVKAASEYHRQKNKGLLGGSIL